ncbi:conserved hypothetical protein [Ricinus communis]|uniref:Uncharacterized protein n=1 Tax=Ricinus communis TaxID=3988 RepID=B9S294_RICCO|nr:conserved hypothetical protein [Ricinus communis]
MIIFVTAPKLILQMLSEKQDYWQLNPISLAVFNNHSGRQPWQQMRLIPARRRLPPIIDIVKYNTDVSFNQVFGSSNLSFVRRIDAGRVADWLSTASHLLYNPTVSPVELQKLLMQDMSYP